MDNQNAISAINSLIIQTMQQLEALQVALKVLTTGYQSDQGTIEKAIADGIAAQLPAAVAAKTAKLQLQIDGLTTDNTDLQKQLAATAQPADETSA